MYTDILTDYVKDYHSLHDSNFCYRKDYTICSVYVYLGSVAVLYVTLTASATFS
jgi:hypothetical protein